MVSTMCVVGASGGLGASSLAAAVALELGRRVQPSVLVDLDLISGGADVTAGVDHVAGVRWSALAGVRGRVDGQAVVRELPGEDNAVILAAEGSRSGAGRFGPAQRAVLTALRESGRPLVIDLPRWLALDVLEPTDSLLVVAGTRTRQLSDVDALVGRVIDGECGPSFGESARLVTCGRRPPRDLIHVMEAHTGLRWLAHVSQERRVAREHERGAWPGWSGPLRQAAIAVVDDIVDQSRAA